MDTAPDQIDEDDSRILQASRDYLAELEAGRKPDRQAYLSRYPDLAEMLSECFDGIELAQSLRLIGTTSQSEFAASPLGDFQIVREIGRGGMGVVYEAVQLSLGRRIALKVLPFATALDAKHLQRFKNEAQAAAQLHHTNIVPVYAVGCERGVHFYAMQLIEGRSLSAVIQELRDVAAGTVEQRRFATTAMFFSNSTVARSDVRTSQTTGRSRESFRTAARIAAQVLNALHYAHEAGIVHRDIKPANLLLDAKGAIWVTDFGLAQVVADVGVTQTGDLVGTLRYMSPEQASGRRTPVDHRADVYSLGATLYELLTLQPIFPSQDRLALLHQILNEDPLPLRQLDRAVPVELETIVMKAMAKDPADRYSTAGEMEADLRRYLEERPILARRPTWVDQGRKWLRRHPSVVAAGVMLLVSGVVGLGIMTELIRREHAATKVAYQRESQRTKEAEARFKLARRAADEMIRLAEEELTDNPFQESLRKRLLESALEYYQEFIASHDEQPDVQTELGVTRDRVKQILDDLAVLHADRRNFLLREEAVLDDLQATTDQRILISKMTENQEERRRDSFRGLRKFLSIEQRKRFLEIARENDNTVASILTPDQLHRLPEIALQCQGPRALHEPEVERALNLTTEQKERIRTAEAEMIFLLGDGFRTGPPQGESFQKHLKDLMQSVLSVLTAEQLKQWQTMTGKPYQGPLFLPGRRLPPDHPLDWRGLPDPLPVRRESEGQPRFPPQGNGKQDDGR